MELRCIIIIITITIIFEAVDNAKGSKEVDFNELSTLVTAQSAALLENRILEARNNAEMEESILRLSRAIRKHRAELAGRMEMMNFQRPKRETVDPLIVPLMIVVDHSAYQKLEKDASRINEFCIELVNQMNTNFEKLFLKVVLTDILIWHEKDSIKIGNDASKTVMDFDAYNQVDLLSRSKHSHAQLITGQDLFDEKINEIMGQAAFNTICTESSSSVVVLNSSDDAKLQALFSTHELAHSLDIGHTSNKCPTCIMAPNVHENPERRFQWTVGNIKNFTNIIEDKQCLFIEQSAVEMFKPNTCGNGVIEEYEEDCDTGQRDIKKADDCDAWTCHAAPESADVSSIQKRLWRTLNEARAKMSDDSHIEGPLTVTLLLVVDHTAYRRFNRDVQRINEFCMEMVANMNSTFSMLHLHTELADVVIWNEKDYFEIEKNAVKTMNDFQTYNKNILLKHSKHTHAQLITGVPQYDDNCNLNFGRAKLNTICTEESSSLMWLHDMDAKLLAITGAHELAHAFNIKHTDSNCSECIMAPSKGPSKDPSDKWIVKNFKDLQRSIDSKMCLFDERSKAEKFIASACGNGFLDEGEECDIGQRDKGNAQCCNPWACR